VMDAYERLEIQMIARRASGRPLDQDWLFRNERYRYLVRETDRLMTQYGQVAGEIVTQGQRAAMQSAVQEANRLLAVAGGSGGSSLSAGFIGMNQGAVTNLVGALQANTQLGRIIRSYGPRSVQQVNRALIQGMALGLNPREVARNVRKAVGITRYRAETLARTEMMRAVRPTLIGAFKASGVAVGWRWLAAEGACPDCSALDGRAFSLEDEMESHPNCRCIPTVILATDIDAEDIPGYRRAA
jgi:SPP1 gp7 family putative phage head morphogenesis protein